MVAWPLVVVSLVLGLAGCVSIGFGNYKTFDEDGIGITFKYPEEFEITVQDVSPEIESAVAGRYVALDDRNHLDVIMYRLDRPVTNDDLPAMKARFDRDMSKATGVAVNSRPMEAGGFEGYEFEVFPPRADLPGGKVHFVLLLDGQIRYTLECESSPEGRAQVDNACDLMLRSLERR